MKKWIIATRPWSFPASAMPVLFALTYLFGTTTHHGETIAINWINGLFALIGAILFQAAGNVINDYFDFKHKVDRKEHSGSSRWLVDGLFQPKSFLLFGVRILTLGAMIGLFLFSRSGIHLLWIGLIGVASTYFYYLLKYRALGDLLIFIIYGQLLPLGTVYVTTGLLDYHMLLISAPIGLLVVNILHANNTRDIRFDKMANIRTLAMWMGIENAKKQYTLLYIASYIGIVVLVLLKALPIACLLSLATLPLAIKNIQRMRLASAEHPEHIKTLDANSAQLLLVFSLLLSLSNVATKFLS